MENQENNDNNNQEDLQVSPQTYNAIYDTRKFEISLLWQRSNVFWLFTAAAFTAFFGTVSNHLMYSIIVCNIGFFCTFCWTLANRGSKFWQTNWEKHMSKIESDFFGG